MQYLNVLHGLLTVALFYIAFLHVPSVHREPAYRDALVLFGDSITESFAAGSLSQRMAERYIRVLDVVNRGFSGYNTRQAIPVLKEYLADQKLRHAPPVQLMTIWFGTNDAVLPSGKQHVPLDEYKTNLKTIVEMVQTHNPETRIVFLTPGPMIPRGNPYRSVERPLAYAQACIEVAEKLRLPCVNAYEAILEAAEGDDREHLAPFLYDGLHYTPKAYLAVFDRLVAVIDKEYPELGTEYLRREKSARLW